MKTQFHSLAKVFSRSCDTDPLDTKLGHPSLQFCLLCSRNHISGSMREYFHIPILLKQRHVLPIINLPEIWREYHHVLLQDKQLCSCSPRGNTERTLCSINGEATGLSIMCRMKLNDNTQNVQRFKKNPVHQEKINQRKAPIHKHG